MPLAKSWSVFIYVVQKDELRSATAVVTNCTALSKSLKHVKISVDNKTTGQPSSERNAQQLHVSARRERPGLSLGSVSSCSCSSGEFVPPARRPLPPVYRSSSLEHDSPPDHSSVLSASQLRSMSREQVLGLLSQKQDGISRREKELSKLNAGIN